MKADKSIEDLKADVINKLVQLDHRKYPANQIAEILRAFSITGSGRKGKIAAIKKLEKGDVQKTLEEINNKITKILDEHVAFFNKKIYLFKLDIEKLNKIQSDLMDVAKRLDVWEEKFNHDPAPDNAYLLCKGEELDSGAIFYFKSERSYFRTVQEKLKSDDEFSNEFPNAKVVGISKKLRFDLNAFDFIKIDFKHSVVVIGMDMANLFYRTYTNVKYDEYKMLIKKFGMLDHLLALNMRKIIPKMENEASGRVVNHDFASAKGGYTYLGKSGARSKNMRDDPFFLEGSKGQELDFFGVHKEYTISEKELPIISLGLTEAEFRDSTTNSVDFAILDYVQSFNGLQFCIDKIMEHLKSA